MCGIPACCWKIRWQVGLPALQCTDFDAIIISLCGQSNLLIVHVAVQFASQLDMAAGKNWKRSSVSYETQVVLGK